MSAQRRTAVVIVRDERWRPVPGYEDTYEVSDQGRVRSLDRVDARGNRRRGRVLRPGTGGNGYLNVRLCKGGVIRAYMVHSLVLTVFVGPRPDGHVTCHGNGIRSDNRVENLRWDTPSANQRDSIGHGTHVETRKTHCPRNHALAPPNLVAAPSKRGHRDCLACGRARSYLQWRPDAGDLQTLADQYYEAIMAGLEK